MSAFVLHALFDLAGLLSSDLGRGCGGLTRQRGIIGVLVCGHLDEVEASLDARKVGVVSRVVIEVWAFVSVRVVNYQLSRAKFLLTALLRRE